MVSGGGLDGTLIETGERVLEMPQLEGSRHLDGEVGGQVLVVWTSQQSAGTGSSGLRQVSVEPRTTTDGPAHV